MRNFDSSDVRILRALQQDGRMTVHELAEAAGMSASPCWRRVKQLEQDGVITGYHAQLHRRALNWGVLVFVSITIEDHSAAAAMAFEAAVDALPEVVACWSVSGTGDFLLQVVATDLDAYADFAMTTIRRMPGIKAMHTTFTLKEVKAPTPWPIPAATMPAKATKG